MGVVNEHMGIVNENLGVVDENLGVVDENLGSSMEWGGRWVADDNDFFPDSCIRVTLQSKLLYNMVYVYTCIFNFINSKPTLN